MSINNRPPGQVKEVGLMQEDYDEGGTPSSKDLAGKYTPVLRRKRQYRNEQAFFRG